jgi:hypothetical protein
MARAEASDMADRVRFESGKTTDPRRAKYAQRVEEAVQAERAAGRNASREAVYYFMLGKDMAEGKYKAKAKPASTKAPDVPRGRTPGVRSDTGRRGPMTEKEKLRARLQDMNI